MGKGEFMNVRLRAVTLVVAAAALLAGSGWGASVAFGATGHSGKKAPVVFTAERIHGVRGLVLAEGKGLVVYTFTGDKRWHAGTCTRVCASVWPPVLGTAAVAHGMKIIGKFGTIHGQITFNGWPLYGFTGEKPRQNNADSQFKVVGVQLKKGSAPAPAPAPSTPAPSPSSGW